MPGSAVSALGGFLRRSDRGPYFGERLGRAGDLEQIARGGKMDEGGGDRIAFRSGCGCSWSPDREITWADPADWINMQPQEEWREKLKARFGMAPVVHPILGPAVAQSAD